MKPCVRRFHFPMRTKGGPSSPKTPDSSEVKQLTAALLAERRDNPQCPVCNLGIGIPLGTLGQRERFRCRACGADFSRKGGAKNS